MLLFGLFLSQALASTVIDPVYWRVDNKRFPRVRRVHFEEKMDIYCPLLEQGAQASSQSHHFQKIWMVDKESYDSCMLNENSRFIMTCDVPHREKKFTLKFQRVSPSPFGFEFDEDDYYIISTSGGQNASGEQLDKRAHGVCQSHHMKMKLEVTQGEEVGVVQEDDAEDTHKEPARPSVDDDYRPYTEPDDEIDEIEEEIAEKRTGTISTAIIIGVVFFVFIMFMIVLAFILFRRTSQKSKSSAFNPSTMSDYTIGKNGRYQDSYQDHQYADSYPTQGVPPGSPLPHPFIGTPAEYGPKIVTLYPKHPAEHGLATSQVANDFTYRPYQLQNGQAAPPTNNTERLTERTDATVLV